MKYVLFFVAAVGIWVTYQFVSNEESGMVNNEGQSSEQINVTSSVNKDSLEEDYVIDRSDFVDVSAIVSEMSLEEVVTKESVLSETEIRWLSYMREEEKLARDVYQKLYEIWDLNIFSNIAKSEETHTEAVKELISRYSLTDPVLDDTVGVFSNEELALLYTDLVSQGSVSLEEALAVGATIEDLDIRDLQIAVEESKQEDIIVVYKNLMKGSRNHLRAFNKQLEKRTGIPYQAKYISDEELKEIINTDTERGYIR
ncbi:MAG: DUF2202 domain-containing protein [Candidatus Paceibacterota bacterium]